MLIREVELNETIVSELIACSEDWEKENSCYGYRKNTLKDIEGNRVFLAMEGEQIVGYLFGQKKKTEEKSSSYQSEEEYFEIEELYIKPEFRSRGIGGNLFQYVEEQLKKEVNLIMLGTATKNFRAILHFYIEEMGMNFWSARLFKRICM